MNLPANLGTPGRDAGIAFTRGLTAAARAAYAFDATQAALVARARPEPPAMLTPDQADRLRAALRAASVRVLNQIKPVVLAAARLNRVLREAANDPVYVAGLEGRMYVRAGLDPTMTAEGLDLLVVGILSGAEDDLWLLTGENRAVVAAAAMAGWAAHRGEVPERMPWHRFIGHTAIQVRLP